MKHALLWKRILHEGFASIPDSMAEPMEDVRHRIVTSPIIVDTRVRDEEAEAGRPWHFADYKTVAWPFNQFWLEGRTVRGDLYGALIEVSRDCKQWPVMSNAPDGAEHLIDLRYVVTCHGSLIHAVGRQALFLDESFELITHQLDQCKVHAAPGPGSTHLDIKDFSNVVSTLCDDVLDCLLLLSCKNVSLESRQLDRKQVKLATKRYGDGGYKYHVLVVRPPSAKSSSGPAQEIGVMPRHVCRGHFAEYGPKYGRGLLFGKYEGRFFIPPHMKGSANRGVVEKDYEVAK